ncbi:hypothetical protein P4H94_25860, partial [Paenibacillus macerans]|uniref:hypothetical protein n=1 Tax=Paenibacillus macerans TaxID=44252 RepID=UPI002DB9528D
MMASEDLRKRQNSLLKISGDNIKEKKGAISATSPMLRNHRGILWRYFHDLVAKVRLSACSSKNKTLNVPLW